MSNKLADELGKTRKVALHLCVEYAGMSPSLMEVHYTDRDENYYRLPEGQLRERPLPGYARVSSIIEITGFAPLARDEVMANAVKSLDAQEREAYVELQKKLDVIRERKQQLLALTHEPQSAEAAAG
jgi:hypothetical protein